MESMTAAWMRTVNIYFVAYI